MYDEDLLAHLWVKQVQFKVLYVLSSSITAILYGIAGLNGAFQSDIHIAFMHKLLKTCCISIWARYCYKLIIKKGLCKISFYLVSCFIKWLFVPLDNALFDKWLYQTRVHKGTISYG